MAAILVDYENVWHTAGLKGLEYLNETDILYIFYSAACSNIRKEYMALIEKSGCDFRICKLVKTGKNALDFYIASECGVISQKGIKQICIISNDKGFGAVIDYFSVRNNDGGEKVTVVTASNIENALSALNAEEDKERRRRIASNIAMLDMSAEHAKYIERTSFKRRIKETLLGTRFEGMEARILQYAEDNNGAEPHQLYTGSLHNFGRKDGVEIYRMLKKAI